MHILNSYKIDSIIESNNPNVNGLLKAAEDLTKNSYDVFTGEELINHAIKHNLFKRIGDWADFVLWAYYYPHLINHGLIYIKIEE